jgi:hypothetical protein
MSRKNHGRWTLAAVLAAALIAASPAQAVPLGGWVDASGMFLRAWQWLAGGGQVGRPAGMGQSVKKDGLHIDPNGLPLKGGVGADPNGPPAVGASPATNSTSDSGMGADPNGG